MSVWLNTTLPIFENIVKPCRMVKYCPYGALIEEYPLKEKKDYMSCKVFGHDCPAYYQAEMVMEGKKPNTNELAEMYGEFCCKKGLGVIR